MSTTTNNPRIDAVRQQVRSSYEELQQLLQSPLDSATLYQPPAPGEWTLMENIAHIVEFMPYWADEVAGLVGTPGKNFGRTMQHEGRLQAIREHGNDSLEQTRLRLAESYAYLDHTLSNLKDSDLEVTGHHVKFGDQRLDWFLEEFVTRHLANHVEQIKACLPTDQ